MALYLPGFLAAGAVIVGGRLCRGTGHGLGTGGSLYYLKHTDVLRGSEQLHVEVRDRVTGQVVRRGRAMAA